MIQSLSSPLYIQRYRKLRWFFLKATLHLVWWDILLNRRGLRCMRKAPLPRWQRLARAYRAIAMDMGGLLIKLGQFLSTRIDILPDTVTDELTGLQDHVPPVSFEEIVGQIENDFARPISDVFVWFSPEPVGSASLAQAHRARLASGEAVAVKVLRPGIDITVETDLRVITQVIRWLKCYKPIRRFVDLDWLAREFITVTRREMDTTAEGRNAERFAELFADTPEVCVPKIFWAYTTPHTLTMEDVAYLKIDDVDAIKAAGIHPSEVARTLFNLYMEQLFVIHFVHADPHAGNLFVKPLPQPADWQRYGPGWTGFRPGDGEIPYHPDRPFQVVFVDFGMAIAIPERLQAALREYVIGVGTRDAHRIVKAYVAMGSALPGADLAQLEALTQTTLDQFWGTLVGQLKDVNLDAYNKLLLQQYRDVTSDGTFQFQADLLFVSRALGVLSGMVTKIDPEFDAWPEIVPFAERLLQEEWRDNWQSWLCDAIDLARLASGLPRQLMDIVNQMQQGTLTVHTALTSEPQRTMQQLKQAVNRQTWILAAVGLGVSGVMWHVATLVSAALSGVEPHGPNLGIWLMILAVVCVLLGIRKRVS